MFFMKGWLPVQRLSHEVMGKFIDSIEDPEFEDATTDGERDAAAAAFMEKIKPEVCTFLWDMLYEASTKHALGCTTAAGNTVLLDPWVTDAESTSSKGIYFDLFDGIICGRLDGLEPFLGLPVVVREAQARTIMAKLAETTLAAEKLRPDEAYIQEIIVAYDKKIPVTKSWVREHITGRIKTVEFDAIWKAAARLRPALSRSGPRGPRRALK